MHSGSLSLDAFLNRRSTDRRLARITHDVPLPEARGIEFGPANNPTALPQGIRVAYVDHATDAEVGLPDAVTIDYAWAGSGSLAAAIGQEGLDFAIAAQVAHYVPNLLGWFRGIHAVLRPGGVLNLSLPDRRFMFDVGRANSTVAELVEASLLGYTRPSLRPHLRGTGHRTRRDLGGWGPGAGAAALRRRRAGFGLQAGQRDLHVRPLSVVSLLGVHAPLLPRRRRGGSAARPVPLCTEPDRRGGTGRV
ncbi:hypothetical protein OFEAOIEE_LOCUS3605 [Methylorubrum extorquens]